jgi:hypothetical protein
MPKTGRFNSFIVPLVTWVVLLIPFAIYQRYYVKAQQAYLTEHGFRLLAAVGRQVDTYISWASTAATTAKKKSDHESGNKSEIYGDYLKDFLPDVDANLTFSPEGPIATNTFSLEFGQGSNPFQRTFGKVPISGKLNLNKGIKDRLNFGEDYFDDILIANLNGEVLFQRSGDTTIANLEQLVSTAAGQELTKQPADNKSDNKSANKSENESANKSKPDPPNSAPSFEKLSQFSNVLEIKVAGDDYKLFLQPFQLTPAETQPFGEKLVLAGMWRSERLNSDSFALPYSTVIWFVLSCVGVGCFAWPFLKINYMGRTERLRQIHGWLLVLSVFMGTTTAILMVLNASYSSQVEKQIDEDLSTLSKGIQANVETELRKALNQLDEMSRYPEVEKLANKPWNAQTSILNNEHYLPRQYKYFEMAFWTDRAGIQLAKFTVDKHNTPQTPVQNRPYFKDLLANDQLKKFLLDKSDKPSFVIPTLATLDNHQYSLQPMTSPTTGLFMTVIAAPYPLATSKIMSQVLVFQPLSLVDSVLPPNFGFAVLAGDGQVLFHSNPLRNLSENFIRECKDPSVMQSAIFSKSPQKLNIVYSGKDRRALVSKLEHLAPEPTTLVVFHNTEVNRTVNLAVILILSVLLSFYTLAIVIAAVIDLLIGKPYPPKFIWPRAECSHRYVFIVIVNSLLLVLYLKLYSDKYELPLLGWTIGALAAGIICTLALLLIKRKRSVEDVISDRLAPQFTYIYVAAAVSLLLVITMIPCFGFFKFAHDAASELALKHEQLTVFHDVSERESRIKNYYQDIKAPSNIVGDRMAEKLDRYDGLPQFISFDQFKGSSQGHEDTQVTGHEEASWFDQWLIWASESFPSNKLGSEMRMLQFDSSDASQAKWDELSDNRFRLNIGDFHLDSCYSKWSGLGPGAQSCLMLLAGLLGGWFFQLVKKIFVQGKQPQSLDHVDWQSADEIQGNYLVLTQPQSATCSGLKGKAGIEWFDLQVDLERHDEKYVSRNSVVILDQFDFDMFDRQHNEQRLQLLERLLRDQRQVVLVSSIDPLYFFSEADSAILADNSQTAAELLGRWAKLMSTFRPVTLSASRTEFDAQLQLAPDHPQERMARWIKDECGHTAYLRDLGIALFHTHKTSKHFDRRTLCAELTDRAESYYLLLWSSLTVSEHLALYQLARDGWANPKNDRAIRQLQLKGYVRGEPMLRIMNKSFRLFIRERAKNEREIADWEQQGAQSSWRSLKFALIATAVGLAAWLSYAQKDLFQGAIGYVLTLGAAVTAIGNIFGSIKGRAPKAPDTTV